MGILLFRLEAAFQLLGTIILILILTLTLTLVGVFYFLKSVVINIMTMGLQCRFKSLSRCR